MLSINQKKIRGMLTLVLVMFIIASSVQESQGCSTGGELADAFNCEDGREGIKRMYICMNSYYSVNGNIIQFKIDIYWLIFPFI